MPFKHGGHILKDNLSVPMGGGGDPHALLLSFAPTFYIRNNEPSGNCINYGSDGGSGPVSGCTQGQTGQLGPGEAYSFDGVDDVVTFANAALPATKALTTQRWVFLVNASSLGESSAARFFVWNSGATTRLSFALNNVLRAVIDTDTVDADAITSNNQVDFIGAWALVFMDYDDGNALGLGRKIRLIRATAASPATLLTLSTNTAGTGTVITPTGTLTIGNVTATSATFAGLKDFGMAAAGLWSPAGAPAVLTDCQRLRHEVFNV